MLKSWLPAIIRIRHAGVMVVTAKADEGLNFPMQLAAGIQPPDVGEVGLVHGDDQVEVPQIGRLDLPRLTFALKSAATKGFGHPWIRW